jgi:hypothetical protein
LTQPIFPDDFSQAKRASIRRRIALAGIVRLTLTILAMVVLASIGYLAWIKIMLSIHLHALK